jgi:2',3'-cyclic-nucleotide 2'-phosphodiesterase (5'-nucleotidase family)
MLLLSAGDVYGGRDVYNQPKCRFIARMMNRFGYDAVALGETDLNFGLDAIVADNGELGMNVICANVFRKASPGSAEEEKSASRTAGGADTAFPPYRVIEREGVRFGVIAILSPALKSEKALSEAGDVEALTYVVKAPRPILADLIPAVRKKSDFVVLLAHMSKTELGETIAGLERIDMVILGHSAKPQVTAEPTPVEDTPVYMASHQGQYLGRAVFTFGKDKRVTGSVNEIRLLDSTVKDDPETIRLVKEFEEENRKLQKELFVKEQLQTESGGPETYLGLGNCQRCHSSEFEAYTTTRHAAAYATLSAVFMQRDSGCIPCHSTGYGELGGFGGIRSRGARLDLVDVQCEACHGPGAAHSRDGAYLKTARESCVGCHTAEQDPEFDFKKAWEQIAH